MGHHICWATLPIHSSLWSVFRAPLRAGSRPTTKSTPSRLLLSCDSGMISTLRNCCSHISLMASHPVATVRSSFHIASLLESEPHQIAFACPSHCRSLTCSSGTQHLPAHTVLPDRQGAPTEACRLVLLERPQGYAFRFIRFPRKREEATDKNRLGLR